MDEFCIMELRLLSCPRAVVVRRMAEDDLFVPQAQPSQSVLTFLPPSNAMIQITDQALDPATVQRQLGSVEAGASVVFTGSTRRWTEGRETVELTYECYHDLAEKALRELEDAARQRWALVECVLLHRVGLVPLGEASVVVGVSAGHRDAAFEAARWLIDTLKEQVPIWKREHWADGTRQWIHPGLSLPTSAPRGSSDAG